MIELILALSQTSSLTWFRVSPSGRCVLGGMKMKKESSLLTYLTLAGVIILSLLASVLYLDSAVDCGDNNLSDRRVAAYRGISVEMVALLHTQRDLSNADICELAADKLERAMYRAENPKPDHPGEAAAFRAFQNGEVPPDALGQALSQMDRMPRIDLVGVNDSGPEVKMIPDGPEFSNAAITGVDITPGGWTWKGPGNIGGRVRAIVIHPTNPSRMWVGAVSGGIWYTSDGGVSWAPVDDFMVNLAVATLIIDPTNSSVMYAGTGEGFFNVDAVRGAGIFKSPDGGLIWTQLSSTNNSDFRWVNRLAISPDGNTLLAATRSGVWRSTNDGGAWTKVLADNYVKDVDFNPTDSNKAVVGSSYAKAYYSTNGGASWTQATGLPSTTGWLARVELAYAPSNPLFVYAGVNLANGDIYKSTNGGQSYSLVNSATTYLGGQGWYDNIVWVDPTNPAVIIVGGIDLYRSINGGVSLTKISNWTNTPTSAHADHHAIVEHPGFNGTSNKTVFFGNDGGVYKTTDYSTATTASGWTELNNQLGITQFYGAAGNVSTGTIVGGTQDNGTLRYTTGGGSEGWNQMYGGDGGFCASDPTNSNYFYGEYTYLQIHRSTNGGVSSSYIDSGISDAGSGTTANFIAPFILDHNNPDRMLAGGDNLWRSNNVKAATPSWASIKSPISTGSATTNEISAIAVAPGNSDIIWVGHDPGHVYCTTNGTNTSPNWTRVDDVSPTSLPNRFMHRLTIDANNNNVVYATFGNYSSNNVYRTSSGCVANPVWTDITGSGGTGLPDVPVRSLVIHPDDSAKLYVGTEVGIFASLDTGATWALPQGGPANVSVDELFWMDRKLMAATHGRGIYEIDLGDRVKITDAWTADGISNPKSIFPVGDPIQWVITVQNNTGASKTVQLTWDVRDSYGGTVKYWQGNITANPGSVNWWFLDTVGEPRGAYTFDGQVNDGGHVTQDSTTYLVPGQVLLVDDDDNSPDVLSYYTETLQMMPISYDIFDTGNTDTREPDGAMLAHYPIVVWFTGAEYGGFAGPGSVTEGLLGTWLDQNNGCLLVSSQDYFWDKNVGGSPTTLMQNYLGVASATNDLNYSDVTGQGSVFGSLGSYAFLGSLPFTNWSDQILPGAAAEKAFLGTSQVGAAVDKTNGSYHTSYWGFPLEFLPASDRQATMRRFLSWCGVDSSQVFLPLVTKSAAAAAAPGE